MKKTLLLSLLLMILASPARAGVSAPCTPGEQWTLQPAQASSRWFREFRESIQGTSSAPLSLSRAIGLKELSRISKSAHFEEEFSEYWTARTLHSLGVPALAREAFESVMKHGRDPDVRQAASACLAQTAATPQLQQPLQQTLREAIQKIKERNDAEAIPRLERFFGLLNAGPGSKMPSLTNEAHLLLGRAYYAVARFQDAAREFQRVEKTSNLEIEALQNLSWAYLMGGQPDDAIGVGLQLSRGPLKKTFAPEGMLVSAMAFHELCQYPEALRVIHSLRRDYAPVWNWLEDSGNHQNGYRQTIAALKHESNAPVKLQTEWIRSPEFLSRQTTINELLEEPARLAQFHLRVQKELQKMIGELNQRTGKFIVDHAGPRKIGRREVLVERYQDLKRGFRALRKMERADHFLARLRKHQEAMTPVRTRALSAEVDAAFRTHQRRLKSQLAAVLRNSEWVEIEVLNGASRDLVWQEAHPGFEAVRKELARNKPGPDSAETWSWGHRSPKDWEESELWEDELGALKADAAGHCELKDQFQKQNTRSTE